MITFSKDELYDLYNLLCITIDDYELEDDDKEFKEDEEKIEFAKSLSGKIKLAYQGLKDGSDASLNMNAEEALVIVNLLIQDIKEHEDKIGFEDDPISYNAERASNMHHLKTRIQKYFNNKYRKLWFLGEE